MKGIAKAKLSKMTGCYKTLIIYLAEDSKLLYCVRLKRLNNRGETEILTSLVSNGTWPQITRGKNKQLQPERSMTKCHSVCFGRKMHKPILRRKHCILRRKHCKYVWRLRALCFRFYLHTVYKARHI